MKSFVKLSAMFSAIALSCLLIQPCVGQHTGTVQWGEWSEWQPVPGGGQQGGWGPWQPVPGSEGEWVQQGEWSPWRPLDGNNPPHGIEDHPGGQGPNPGGRTATKIVERQIRVFNPATGQYETRTIQETVTVDIGQPTPGGNQGSFLVTFINQHKDPLTISIGNQSQQVQSGSSWQATARDGQQYSYSGPNRQIAPGRWVSGSLMSGIISANQRTITIGQAQPAPDPNQPNGSFLVTFINNTGKSVTMNVGNQSKKLLAGQQWQVYMKDGQDYGYSGEPYSPSPGVMLGGGTYRGIISRNQPVVRLGGNDGPGGQGDGGQGGNQNEYVVTFINKWGGPITLTVGNQSQKLTNGQSWPVNTSYGQVYSFTGEPRQTGPGMWVGGGAGSGTVPFDKRTVIIGGGQNDGPGGGQGGNPDHNEFQVTFINSYSSPVRIVVYDNGNTQITARRLEGGQSTSITGRPGYYYIQEGPTVYRNGGAVSGTSRGDISPTNPVVRLGG